MRLMARAHIQWARAACYKPCAQRGTPLSLAFAGGWPVCGCSHGAVCRPGGQPCGFAGPRARRRHLHVHAAHRQQRPQRRHGRHADGHTPGGLHVRGCGHHRRHLQSGGWCRRLHVGQYPVQQQPDRDHPGAAAFRRGLDQHRHGWQRHDRSQHQQQRQQRAGHHRHAGGRPCAGGYALHGQRGGRPGLQLRAAGCQQRPECRRWQPAHHLHGASRRVDYLCSDRHGLVLHAIGWLSAEQRQCDLHAHGHPGQWRVRLGAYSSCRVQRQWHGDGCFCH